MFQEVGLACMCVVCYPVCCGVGFGQSGLDAWVKIPTIHDCMVVANDDDVTAVSAKAIPESSIPLN